jgi:multidrug efflux system membrane fusion protein
VITEGADRLKDGAKVMLPGDRPAGGRAQGQQGQQGQPGQGQHRRRQQQQGAAAE